MSALDYTSRNCTGTLITPVWLLTANHCITGGAELHLGPKPVPTANPVDDIGVTFVAAPYSPTGPFQYWHTMAKSGPVLVRKEAQFSVNDLDDSQDVALVLLNHRVPMTGPAGVLPSHPPVDYQSMWNCFSATEGTIIGYGSTDPIFPTGFARRNSNASSGWTTNSSAPGEMFFQNSWGPLELPGTYGGPLQGDSGGPLMINGQVCGVCSAFFPAVEAIPLPPFVEDVLAADYAALTSENNLAFLLAHVFDPNRPGTFMGECNEGPQDLRDVDSDGDLIPDACDPCPNVAAHDINGRHTYDHSHDPDEDHDGVPDACDNCPWTPNPYNPKTHTQSDVDGDGLGDACDTCAGSDVTGLMHDLECCMSAAQCPGINGCVPGPGDWTKDGLCAGWYGRCAFPVDADFDQVGDWCDNCPGISNPGPTSSMPGNSQPDTDGDGVGDACDNCPGHAGDPQTADINPACNPYDDHCWSYHSGSVCVWPHFDAERSTFTQARCTLGFDQENYGVGDGIGDACDNCPGEKNTDQANCNRDIERLFEVPYPGVGDACDPNPCAYASISSAYIGSPICGAALPGEPPPICPDWDPRTDDVWYTVAYSPTLLPQEKAAAAFHFAQPPAATVTLRHCKCPDASPWLCYVSGRCPIGSDSMDDQRWRVPKMQSASGPLDSAPSGQHYDDPIFVPDATFDGMAMASSLPGNWSGLEDTGRKTYFAHWDFGPWSAPENTVGPVAEILWTHVSQVPQFNEFASSAQFWQWSNHYSATYLGRDTLPQIPAQSLIWGKFGCGSPECDLPPFLEAVIAVYDPSWKFAVQGIEQQKDLTSRVSPVLMSKIAAGGSSWVAVAEDESWLRSNDARLAAVLNDGTAIDVVGGWARGRIEAIGGRSVPARVARTEAGGASCYSTGATEGCIGWANALAIGADGAAYVIDGNRVLAISPTGTITPLVETTDWTCQPQNGLPGLQTCLEWPQDVAIGPDGAVYVAEYAGRIRRVGTDTAHTVTTIAGVMPSEPDPAGPPSPTSTGDGGPAVQAQLAYPSGVTVGPDGSVYIVESMPGRLRRVNNAGVIETVAGGGVDTADGVLAIDSTLVYPQRAAVAGDGTVYVSDPGTYRVRRVRIDGHIDTVAGTGSYGGSSATAGAGAGLGPTGDGTPATLTALGWPSALAVSAAGDLFITDSQWVRRVDQEGMLTTIAGNPVGAYSTTGSGGSIASLSDKVVPATVEQLMWPRGLAVRPGDQGLLVADAGRVVRVSPLAPPRVAPPAPRVGFRAALSGVERAVFVVGGSAGAASPAPFEPVLRFSTDAGTWQPVPVRGVTLQTVLAVTYRPEDRSLYIVDEASDGETGRLVRLDLGHNMGTVVATFARHQDRSRVFLSHGARGRLVLAASSTARPSSAVILGVSADGNVIPEKAMSISGELVFEPILTASGLSVALAAELAVQVVVVPSQDLTAAPSQSLDEYL